MPPSNRWTCDKCNETVAMTHNGHHRKYRCPRQGNLLRATQRHVKASANAAARQADAELKKAEAKPAPKYWQYLPCLCCGVPIGQVKGQRKRQFVDASHYEAWRRAQARATEGDVELVAERKHAEDVAALAAKEETIRREADAVRLLSREESFALWARCLGFNVGDSASAAA